MQLIDDNVGAATWSSIECNTGIICACLPTLRPLMSKLRPYFLPSSTSSLSSFRAPPARARVNANRGNNNNNTYEHDYRWLDCDALASPRLDVDKERTISDLIRKSDFADGEYRWAHTAASGGRVRNQPVAPDYDNDHVSELALMQHKDSPSGFSFRTSKDSAATSPTLASPPLVSPSLASPTLRGEVKQWSSLSARKS